MFWPYSFPNGLNSIQWLPCTKFDQTQRIGRPSNLRGAVWDKSLNLMQVIMKLFLSFLVPHIIFIMHKKKDPLKHYLPPLTKKGRKIYFLLKFPVKTRQGFIDSVFHLFGALKILLFGYHLIETRNSLVIFFPSNDKSNNS